MRRGFAPSLFPTAGTAFPPDTLLFNASLFCFSRGVVLLSLRRYAPPPSRREALMHVARESTVVPRPISSIALHRIKFFRCALALPLIGFSNTVTTRVTECTACHGCIAAGSPSDVRGVDMPVAYQLKRGSRGAPPVWGSQKGQSPV